MKKIVIVGGGTAGWFTASYLSKFLSERYDITLVESPAIPKIGVGESVTPHVAAFFQQLGIDERHWMLHSGSVYKYANKFVGWNHSNPEPEYFGFHYTSPSSTSLPKSIEDCYYRSGDMRNTDTVLSSIKNGSIDKFDRYFHWHYHYMEKNVAPFDDRGYIFRDQPFSYSQHVNAEALADYCRDFIAVPNGVRHVRKKVVDVKVSDKGIDSISLEDGAHLVADVFVDCSGFQRLLMNAVGAKIKRYENNPIDRAWVCQVNYQDRKTQLVNYTQSIAREHGWQFKIGLYHRMGTGYCYSSSHCIDEQAEKYFRDLIGDTNRIEPRLIKWTPERLVEPGIKNTAAVGLSNGFIEPLEANALYIIVANIYHLAEALEGDTLNFDRYNSAVNFFMDDIADFLLVHYTLGDKIDNDFWKDCKKIGLTQRHEQLVSDKYHDERNFMCSAVNGIRTLFPDYMWAQLAASWQLDIEHIDYHDTKIKTFLHRTDNKHRIQSARSMNYSDWLEKNVFDNIESDEWQDIYLKK